MFLILILLRSCLTSAEKRLTPSVFNDKDGELRDPDNFNIQFNEKPGPVDPFKQFRELPRMNYLDFDIETTDLNEEEKK